MWRADSGAGVGRTSVQAFLTRHWVALSYFCLLAFIYTLLRWESPGRLPLIVPDTVTYVKFAAHRTAGYPSFLWAIRHAGLGLDAAVYCQIAFFAVALEYFFHTMEAYLRPRWLIFVVLIAVSLNPAVIQFHFTIMTESIFDTALVWFLSSMIRAMTRGSMRDLLALSIAAGVAVVVRPVGYSLVPILAILAAVAFWNDKRRIVVIALAAFAPLAIFILAEAAVYNVVHGPDRTSLAPAHMFGKSMLVAPGSPPYAANDPRTALWTLADAEGAPARAYLAQAPQLVRRELLVKYENLFYERYVPGIVTAAADAATGNSMPKSRALILGVSRDRLIADPLGYADNIGEDYYALWTPFSGISQIVGTASSAWQDTYARWLPFAGASPSQSVNDYLLRHPPPLLADAGHPFQLRSVIPIGSAISFILNVPFLFVGLLTFFVAVFGFLVIAGKNAALQDMRIAGMAALVTHGNFLLVALTGIGMSRYTVTMLPSIVVSLAWLYPQGRRLATRLTTQAGHPGKS